MLIAGQKRGLSYEQMNDMELGELLDYCIEHDNQQMRAERKAKGPQRRQATAADWASFLGR